MLLPTPKKKKKKRKKVDLEPVKEEYEPLSPYLYKQRTFSRDEYDQMIYQIEKDRVWMDMQQAEIDRQVENEFEIRKLMKKPKRKGT